MRFPHRMATLPHPWICLILSTIMHFPAPAADAVPPVNAIFVGEIFETPANPALLEQPFSYPEFQERGLQALKKKETRFVDLKVVTGESGHRCVSEGRDWTWDVSPVAEFEKNILGGNFAIKRSGQESMSPDQGPSGRTFFVRAVPGGDDKTMEVGFATTAFANTAKPAVSSHTPNKATIVFEVFELPLEKAGPLIKPEQGRIDCGKLLQELRLLTERGTAAANRLPTLTLANGRYFETKFGNLNLMIEPTLSKNEDWVEINYRLTEGGNVLTAKVNIKNGDSLLLGSMESTSPGTIRLVFVHTSAGS